MVVIAATLIVAEARASCTSLSPALTQPMVERFVANPGWVLDRYRGGEPGLATEIGTLLKANTRLTLQPILKLAMRGNSRQKVQIGQGISSAVNACRRFDPETSRAIERAMRDVTDRDVLSGAGSTRTARPDLLGRPSLPGGSSPSSLSGGPSPPEAGLATGRVERRELLWDPFRKQGLPGSAVGPIRPVR